MVDGRARAVDVEGRWVRTHEGVEVARLKLVRVQRQPLQVGDAVVAAECAGGGAGPGAPESVRVGACGGRCEDGRGADLQPALKTSRKARTASVVKPPALPPSIVRRASSTSWAVRAR